MGIKGLNTFLKLNASNAIERTHLSKYKGQSVAIDAYIYIYKFLYSGNHINGLFFQINKFKKFNIKPIYIFDGKPPSEKNETLEKRYKKKIQGKHKIIELKKKLEDLRRKPSFDTNLEKKLLKDIIHLEKKQLYITREVIERSKQLFNYMGVHYIVAPCEAEHYCSLMIKSYLVDLVLSEDMDTIPCGSHITLRSFSNKQDYVLEYRLEKILNNLNLNMDEFIDMSILFGGDYIHINNKDTKYNYELIKTYHNLENLVLNSKIKKHDFILYRNLYKLNNIKLLNEHVIEINKYKKTNIRKLDKFLKKYSTLDKKVYYYRINKMFYKNGFKCDCIKNIYYKKLKNNYIKL